MLEKIYVGLMLFSFVSWLFSLLIAWRLHQLDVTSEVRLRKYVFLGIAASSMLNLWAGFDLEGFVFPTDHLVKRIAGSVIFNWNIIIYFLHYNGFIDGVPNLKTLFRRLYRLGKRKGDSTGSQ